MSGKRKYDSLREDREEDPAMKELETEEEKEEPHVDQLNTDISELDDSHSELNPTKLSVDLLDDGGSSDRADSPQIAKRSRLCLHDVDSPSSSSDSLESRDSCIESEPVILTGVTPPQDHFLSPIALSNIPEVIDLSTPSNPQVPVGQSDVVDLTAEPTSPTRINDVVDLTEDQFDASPVIISVHKIFQRPYVQQRPSCRFESATNDNDLIQINQSSSNNINEQSTTNQNDDTNKSVISCPICLDDVNVLKRRKRQLNSTICGHVFCDKCIRSAIKSQNKCPTCRKKLTLRQIHPLFL